MTKGSRLVRSELVLVREIESGTLLLRPDGGPVLSLTGSGPTIWSMLRHPMSVSDLVLELARRFDVEPEVIQDDVRHVVALLVDAKLVNLAAA